MFNKKSHLLALGTSSVLASISFHRQIYACCLGGGPAGKHLPKQNNSLHMNLGKIEINPRHFRAWPAGLDGDS